MRYWTSEWKLQMLPKMVIQKIVLQKKALRKKMLPKTMLQKKVLQKKKWYPLRMKQGMSRWCLYLWMEQKAYKRIRNVNRKSNCQRVKRKQKRAWKSSKAKW
uniref:Uncharacterized protein n=1 Tax=Cacopsylla melanoneura TaxID=428564 RepID=A0A8D8QY61_9HEMI